MICPRWIILLTLAVTMPSRAAAEDDVAKLAFEELDEQSFRKGEQVEIVGKYVELRGDEVVLHGSEAVFRASTAKILRRVLALETDHETLHLRLSFRSRAANTTHFDIIAVGGGPPLAEHYPALIEHIAAEGSEKSVERLLALTSRIVDASRSFHRRDLRDVAFAAGRKALEVRESLLEPSDIATRLEDVRSLRKVLPSKRFVMELLVDLESRFPKADEIREELIELECRKYQGRWMTYTEFKTLQGYSKQDGRWLSAHEKSFTTTIRSFLKRKDGETILRRRLPREYELLSSRGQVALGMTPEEVHAALGFPDRVYRQRQANTVFTQWTYGDSYYYFAGGLLFNAPSAQ